MPILGIVSLLYSVRQPGQTSIEASGAFLKALKPLPAMMVFSARQQTHNLVGEKRKQSAATGPRIHRLSARPIWLSTEMAVCFAYSTA